MNDEYDRLPNLAFTNCFQKIFLPWDIQNGKIFGVLQDKCRKIALKLENLNEETISGAKKDEVKR